MSESPDRSFAKPQTTEASASLDLSLLFILASAALATGVVLQRPHLCYSPNDASRWNTVYYLVQHGTYEYLLDTTVSWANRANKKDFPRWDTPVLWTIDMIQINGKLYSSKPPLLPTCIAGVVWVTQKLTGLTFHDHPLFMVRTALIAVQVLPFVVMLVLLRAQVFRLTDSAFVRNFCMACVCLSTYLTPWLITLNNHVIAAATGMVAIHAAIRIWYDGRREWWWFALAGFFGALTAAFELPAGLLAAGVLLALLAKDAKRTLLIAVIAAVMPTFAFLYTNYLVTGDFTPVYARFGVKGGPYDYEGSYWHNPTGIDALAEPKPVYILHMLIGHNGFFLLTPILAVCLVGLIIELKRRERRPLLAGFVAGLMACVVAVYARKTNNYGGGCQGLRWLFWLIPLWLLFLPAGVELLSRRRPGRVMLYTLLTISLFSVAYAMENPWTATWLRLAFNRLQWINY